MIVKQEMNEQTPRSRLVAKPGQAARLADIIAPVIAGMGCQLVRVLLSGRDGQTVQIMIDRPEKGILTITDCSAVSRALSAVLDVEDPIPGTYNLEISSPGIDRPLTRLKDFTDWQNHQAKIEMAMTIENRRRFLGVLKGVKNNTVMIETKPKDEVETRIIPLPFQDITSARLVLTDELIRQSLKQSEQQTETIPASDQTSAAVNEN